MRVAAVLCLAALVLPGTAVAAPGTLDAIQNDVRQTVASEAAVQKQVDDWAPVRDDMLEEIRTLTLEIQWLELQEKKLERYVASNDKKIRELEDRHSRYAIISLALENSLLGDLERLKKTVADGPDFLPEERRNRLRFLEESLDDPDLGIGEKYRRVMEGLNTEAEYGRGLETAVQTAVFDGKEMELATIRAGRVGLYCLTFDRSRAGMWDAASRSFLPVDDEALLAVRALEELALSKQYHKLAPIPLGRPGS